LTYSVERIEKNSLPYQASCTLWQDGFQLILPELLKFLRFVIRNIADTDWVLTLAQLCPRIP
jgi:exportin-5